MVGRAALVAGAALLMFAAAGVSSTLLPQFEIFYAAGGTGVVAIVAGFLLGAVRLDDK